MKKKNLAIAMAVIMAATQLTVVDFNHNVLTVKAADSEENVLVIPEGTTKINTYQYRDRTDITSVVIPDSVTIVDYGAFAGCTNLIAIELPDTIEMLAPSAFKNCSSLQSIVIPNGVDRIWNDTFSGCTSLTDITLPDDNFVSIGAEAFADCSSLTSIIIPKSVGIIGNGAFAGCKNLRDITFKGSTPEISQEETVDSIIYSSMRNALEIADDAVITVPKGSLEAYELLLRKPKFALSPNVQIVEDEGNEVIQTPDPNSDPNEDKKQWETLTIEEGPTFTFSFQFAHRHEIEKVILPDTIEMIGYGSFFNCLRLKEVTFPNSLGYIAGEAFRNCSRLTSIEIPENVTNIDQGAFDGCEKLTTITFKGTTPPEFGVLADDRDLKTLGIAENAVIYVPSESLETYEAALRQEKVGLPASVQIIGYSASEVPIAEPTEIPTAEPTEVPTVEPTEVPTEAPTAEPTPIPTEEPLHTAMPIPTEVPTAEPTEAPIAEPTPTVEPTIQPIEAPISILPPTEASNNQTTTNAVVTSKLSTSTTTKSKTLKIPKITKFKENTKLVKGTGVASAKVIVKVGSKRYTSKVNKKGNYTVKTCKLKKGQKIKVYLINAAGVKSKVKTVTVK